MTEKKKQIEIIKSDFKDAQPILNVVGDETRQLILLVLMESDCKEGMRVGEITEKQIYPDLRFHISYGYSRTLEL